MRFLNLSEGFVTKRLPHSPAPVATGPRCVVADNGDLVCSYMVQSKIGINDFVPTISRSNDGGHTWSEQGPIWPEITKDFSFFVNISRSASGELFLFGSRSKIDTPGESFWSDATQGLKQTQMIWASSTDHGRTWSKPHLIPQLLAGSHEAPGPLAITRNGNWVGPYSPYNTFDPGEKVDREHVVALTSSDRGRTWNARSMIRFEQKPSGGAESWCIELSDGRLLATSWHLDHTPGDQKTEFPNKYSLSHDGGMTWSKAASTGTMGHTTALAALPDGKALFVNVRRKPASDVGIWLAICQPTDTDFGILHNQLVWTANKATQQDKAPEHFNWTSFNFGEPCVTVLRDGTLQLFYWFIAETDSGIGWVKLKMVEGRE